MEEPEETVCSSSDEFHLTIAETPKKKKRSKVKQQVDFEMSSEAKNLDKTIETTILKCKNLTSDVARKMLCKLVKNDHVLALALLKAEEEEGRERFQSESSEVLSGDENDKRSDSDAPVTPKLTRLKAKQLNQQLPIPGNLLTTHPDEEVVKLINEELKSDSEDEEYQPDADSDGDITNTTFSDIDSQPSTPGSALVNNEELDSPLKGEFKVPKTPLTAEEQENIARRTRSKLCLQTTSIETIESTFILPDIDYDLYDFNQDFENLAEDELEWKDFLNKCYLPLSQDDEKYDEADPEYIANEQVPFDKEELRSVRVPKKELSDLISELFEDSSLNFNEPSTSSRSKNYESNKNVKKPKPTPSKGNKYPAPKISSKAELNTPPHVIESDARNRNLDVTPEQPLPQSHYYYSPQLLQTPLKNVQQTPLQSPAPYHAHQSYQPSPHIIQPQMQSPVPQYSSLPAVISSPTTLVASPQLPQTPSVLVMNQNQLEIRPLADNSGAFNTNSIINQGIFMNGAYTLPQYQSVVIQVPTIQLLQNGLNFSFSTSLGTEPQQNVNVKNLTDDTKRKLKKECRPECRLSNFDYLNSDQPENVSGKI
jgi:hypothetical protein